jgi:hypothetical protein
MAAKQREEKVGRNAPTPQPEQAIQPTAKVLCNSICNSSTPTYTAYEVRFHLAQARGVVRFQYRYGTCTSASCFYFHGFLLGVVKGEGMSYTLKRYHL